MLGVEYKKSRIMHSEFLDTGVPAPKDSKIGVELNANFEYPNEVSENSKIIIKATVSFGNKDTFLFITMTTLNLFTIENFEADDSINDEFIEKNCMPTVISKLRNYFNETTKLYGYSKVELPFYECEDN